MTLLNQTRRGFLKAACLPDLPVIHHHGDFPGPGPKGLPAEKFLTLLQLTQMPELLNLAVQLVYLLQASAAADGGARTQRPPGPPDRPDAGQRRQL